MEEELFLSQSHRTDQGSSADYLNGDLEPEDY